MHVLNGCKVRLEQGKYKQRHDNIVHFLLGQIKNPSVHVTCDIPGANSYNGTTIDPAITVTPLNSDLVVRSESDIKIFELTVPHEENHHKSHDIKVRKNSHFLVDISKVKPPIICFEIGFRGIITLENKAILKLIHELLTKEMSFKKFLTTLRDI